MEKKIIKRDGALSEFNPKVLYNSLKRAGASEDVAREVTDDIKLKIKDGDSTNDIYKEAFELLGEKERSTAMKYSLKRALFSFGPTGFPFEKFVGEIFSRKGFDIKNNVHIKGKCANHEVDIYAVKGMRKIAIEVKFHNTMAARTDMRTLLYVKARFDDLIKHNLMEKYFGKCPVTEGLLMTNTKFTSSAISYAKCSGTKIIGWGYPSANNLKDLIEEVNAHPVTCLPSLNKKSSKLLFDNGVTSCRGLMERVTDLKKYSIDNFDTLVKESKVLCTVDGRVL